MRQRRVALLRRVLVLGGLSVAAGAARAQSSRDDKFLAWVHRVERETSVVPLYGAGSLGFSGDVSAGRQVTVTREGVQRAFTVIAPFQPDRVVLVVTNPVTRAVIVHRTDVHLRRVASARSIGGRTSAWSGPDCDADFAAQVDFWIAETVH